MYKKKITETREGRSEKTTEGKIGARFITIKSPESDTEGRKVFTRVSKDPKILGESTPTWTSIE